MSGLSREILKWMQSLDLSYSVKNVRRDFSNGFLVAEIFSRYFKDDIPMHSFDNGTSLARRKDNWRLLQKFFKKMGFPIEPDQIEAVIHCKSGASVPLIEQIYTILTNKTVQKPQPIEHDDYVPPFARPTASKRVKDRFKDPDAVGVKDITGEQTTAEAVLQDHNQQLQYERTNEPERFTIHRTPNHLGNRTQKRVPARQVAAAQASTQPKIEFKGVQVKQLEDSVAHLRATASRASAAHTRQSHVSSNGGQEGLGPASAVGGVVGKPSLELLNMVVTQQLKGTDLYSKIDPRKDAAVCFVDDLTSFPAEAAADLFAEMERKVGPTVADNCLASPKEFWVFFGIVWKGIALTPAGSPAFAAAAQFLCSVGKQMIAKDDYVPFALFTDFALNKTLDLMKASPVKVPTVVNILFSYSPADVDEHLKVIRQLRDGLDDLPTLVKSLSSSILLETEFSKNSIDLYLYYVVAGLKNPSPSVRADSVAILAGVADVEVEDMAGYDSALNLLDRLEPLATDGWPVQAQLLRAYCTILGHMSEEHPQASKLYELIEAILTPEASPLVKEAGLASLPRCMLHHQDLRGLFLSLIMIEPAIREKLLGLQEVENEGPSPGTPAMQEHWQPLSVALAVLEDIQINKPDNLSPAHVELLAAAVDGVGPSFPAEQAEQWNSVYAGLRDFVILELYDPSLCEVVAHFLSRFLLDPQTQDTATQIMVSGEDGSVPPLYAILRLVFSEGDEKCRHVLHAFLEDLAGHQNTAFPSLVYKLLKNLASHEGQAYQSSSLPELVHAIENSNPGVRS